MRAIQHYAGLPPLSARMFIDAVLSHARTGRPWQELPEDCGHGVDLLALGSHWGYLDHDVVIRQHG